MKRFLSVMLCLTFAIANAISQGFPTISTENETKWYLIQFMNGGNALTAENPGENITTAAAIGSKAQLWKITGDATKGYTFTNKKGYTLFVNSADKNQMVMAAESASGVSTFFINEVETGYEIRPEGNTNISMNLWGGPAENRGVGLWDKNNENNPVEFVDFENIGKIAVIPYPAEMTIGEGNLAVSSLKTITYPNEYTQQYVEDFAEMLATTSGTTLEVKPSGDVAAEGEIYLAVDDTLPTEGYTLVVNDKNIEIKASAKVGFFYAIQTLKQLLPRALFSNTQSLEAEWVIPHVSIIDQPQFSHRGFMMDVARHFFDKEEVKKVLDIMALYKMNRLHWHLTDDQGWRIEIPEYPLLTEVGAIRSGSFTSPGDGSKFFDDTEYGRGMWFSQKDLREIVAYAAERNIEILPEIDLPGHMVAAVTAYPEFSCDPTKEYSVRIDGGISHDVLNIGKDETIAFLKCILDNVASIFPFPYIHIGGDECPVDQWTNNADCQRRVQEEGLTGVNELQSWLVEELGTYLKDEYKKDIVVWDELLSNWKSDNKVKPVIMAWNSLDLTKTAADKGFKSIVCPYSHVYIDFMQVGPEDTEIDEPYYGGWGDTWTNTLEEAYSLNPTSSLSGREEYCMGVQCNLWAETLNDNTELEYQLLPRMIGVAETGWLPASKKDWVSFYKRLQSHDEILDLLGYVYAKHYIEPKELTVDEQAVQEAEEILANNIRGGVGYPAAEFHDALQTALNEGVTESIQTAVANYKNAAIIQPEAGKTYSIISASTYYKRQYEGSTIYQSGNGVRFHYTPQTEPEELWQFVPTTDGYIMKNLLEGKALTIEGYNTAIKMTNNGTAVRIDKATIASSDITYVPGAVTISAVEGYDAAMTGNVKRLSAETSGDVYAKDEAALCYNGTWKIVEVTDFTAQLAGLVKKCEIIILNAKPGKMGEPTEEAIDYLQNSVITPAKSTVEDGAVTEEQYNAYVALYHQFVIMPRASFADTFDTTVYYYICNGYHTDKYAALNTSTKEVESKAKATSDNYLWRIVKNNDGTVYIRNKATGEGAYINNNADDETVYVGRDYAWTLRETTTDLGGKGISIISGNGTSGWYTNPTVWEEILTKPYDWGASIWTFEKSDIQVETGIEPVIEGDTANMSVYDLQGRPAKDITRRGIYIVNGKKVVVK